MRILVATDAWFPQVNGVVRTLTALAKAMEGRGVEIEFLTPEGMPTVALPSYPGIRLALPSPRRIAARIAEINPDAIHIATEGPIGLVTRWYCGAQGRSYTTSFHTRFAEYVAARWPIPERLSWRWLRWFHNGGRGTMTATASLADELTGRGFRRVLRWPRGVDAGLFRPRPDARLGLLRPIFLTVGRLAVEKNIAAFLSLDLPGTKVVVGEGPARDELAPPLSQGDLSRPQARRGAGQDLRRRRCLRVSEPHRYIRAGAAGGARLRDAGRGLSGGGDPRRGRERAGGGARRGLARRLPERAGASARRLP